MKGKFVLVGILYIITVMVPFYQGAKLLHQGVIDMAIFNLGLSALNFYCINKGWLTV